MNQDIFARLAARALGKTPLAQPRLGSVFEPEPAHMVGDTGAWLEVDTETIPNQGGVQAKPVGPAVEPGNLPVTTPADSRPEPGSRAAQPSIDQPVEAEIHPEEAPARKRIEQAIPRSRPDFLQAQNEIALRQMGVSVVTPAPSPQARAEPVFPSPPPSGLSTTDTGKTLPAESLEMASESTSPQRLPGERLYPVVVKSTGQVLPEDSQEINKAEKLNPATSRRDQRAPSPAKETAGSPPTDVTSESEPVIHVTIGRIEVRAVRAPETPARADVKRPAPALPLEDYLKGRNEGNL